MKGYRIYTIILELNDLIFINMKLSKEQKQFIQDEFITGLKALVFILSISIIGILIYLNL